MWIDEVRRRQLALDWSVSLRDRTIERVDIEPLTA